MTAPIHPEDVYACDIDSTVTMWVRGHVPKRRFKGAVLSGAGHYDWSDSEGTDKAAILKSKVRHGWVITCAGDFSGCGWDMSMFFTEQEPKVEDGRWAGDRSADVSHMTYEEDDDGNEREIEHDDAEVIDGPHLATWMVIDSG